MIARGVRVLLASEEHRPRLRGVTTQSEPGSVRLAELVAMLSLGADLGLGQPMAHCIRRTAIALRLADTLGLDDRDRATTYYLGLMMNVYCHADAAEQAAWFGDDISFKEQGYGTLGMNTAQVIAFFLRRIGSGDTGIERARRLAMFPVGGYREMNAFMNTHTLLASEFAGRIGLDETAQAAMRQAYAQWDGKGQPSGLAGEAIALPARIVPVADVAEVFGRTRGLAAARAVVRKHRGGIFDPAIADAFDEQAAVLVDDLDDEATWVAVIDHQPWLDRRVAGAELDDVLEAMADLVDMKAPHMAGHSRGVASLAAEAGRLAGLPSAAIVTLRRAGLVHDFGRLGVSNTIWDKTAALTEADRERVRLHPYLTDRMLARVPALGASREIAARHHERLDGSGYPSGLLAGSLSLADRLLAAADAYHAMTEPRPYRPALEPDRASEALRAEATAGRLDGEAIGLVLRAAGQRAPALREWPAGLTAREVEVLGLLARGHSNREIATMLTVTPKTISNHVEHIYAKIDVSSRASATLFATQHGLVGSYEAA